MSTTEPSVDLAAIRAEAKAEALREFAASLREIPRGVNAAHDYWVSRACAADEADERAAEILSSHVTLGRGQDEH